MTREDGYQEERYMGQERKNSLGGLLRRLFDSLKSSSLQLDRNGRNVVTIPSLVFGIILVLKFRLVVAAMAISLFFGVRYHFVGAFHSVNEILDKASDIADDLKGQFGRKSNRASAEN